LFETTIFNDIGNYIVNTVTPGRTALKGRTSTGRTGRLLWSRVPESYKAAAVTDANAQASEVLTKQ
jgi:hypothetical protein